MDLSNAALLVAPGQRPAEEGGRARPASRQSPSDTQGRIIEAAEGLFRQFGHRKTTVADIAGALSMSPANIYRFFPSKDAICQAVCRRLLADLTSVADGLPQRNATDRLRASVSALTRCNIEQFRANEPLRQLFASATDENWPVMREYLDRIETILATIVADGVGRGEFRKADARRAARCVYTSMLQHLHPTPAIGRDDRAQASLDDMLNFCLAALRHGELSQDRGGTSK